MLRWQKYNTEFCNEYNTEYIGGEVQLFCVKFLPVLSRFHWVNSRNKHQECQTFKCKPKRLWNSFSTFLMTFQINTFAFMVLLFSFDYTLIGWLICPWFVINSNVRIWKKFKSPELLVISPNLAYWTAFLSKFSCWIVKCQDWDISLVSDQSLKRSSGV